MLTALSSDSSSFATVPARRLLAGGDYGEAVGGRMIRVYERLDVRLALADFMAILR